MTFNEAEHPRAVNGEFTGKRDAAPAGTLTADRDLSRESPVTVDEELAELYYARVKTLMTIERLQDDISRAERRMQRVSFGPQAAACERQVARAQAQIAEAERTAADLLAQQEPLEAEYQRRGRWPRVFLVTGGHAHSSMSCSTCNREGRATRFTWMTDYSGMTEEEIVAAAGDRACTTCYPSAPVSVLSGPSAMSTPEEKQQAQERADRDADRARKAADKAAKSITNPDGTPLVEPRRYGQEVRTLVTAERELVANLVDAGVSQARRQPVNPEHVAHSERWRQMLIEAIAHKRGITADQVQAEYGAKADKKVATIVRSWG